MEESGIENPLAGIIRRKNAREVVGSKPPSKLLRVAGRAVPIALVAASFAGTVKAVSENVKGQDPDEGVSVTQVARQNEMSMPEKVYESQAFFDTVFHNLDSNQKALVRQQVDMFKGKIVGKSDYIHAHQEIPLKYQKQIEQTAKAYGIAYGTLIGIISVENGGVTNVVNVNSGARGVAQFLPDTARQYGLLVGPEIDERTDPVKSIAAAGKYLEQNKTLFSNDEGLALWSYHAGAGVVFQALRVYFLDKNKIDIGDYAGAIVSNNAPARQKVETMTREFMKQDSLDISKLLTNKAVQEQVLSRLDDFSDTYTFQAVAASELLNEHSSRVKDLGGGLKISVDKTFSSSPHLR